MNFSLNRLWIQNFRGVKTVLELDFSVLPSGLYFIQGINEAETRLGSNGAGKSTVFIDAIYWALTGRIARSQRPGDIVENWDNERKVTRVVIDFQLDDTAYTIERTRNPNNLLLDGTKVEQETIDDLLPLTDTALRRSIFIDQFGDMFLSLRPEAQSRIFSETLDLDQWIEASDKASDAVTDVGLAITTTNMKLSRVNASAEEASDEYDIAIQNKQMFDDSIRARIKEAREKAEEAAVQARSSLEAVSTAREALAAEEAGEANTAYVAARTAVTKLTAQVASFETIIKADNANLTRLQKQIELYSNTTTCPECNQTVTPEHIKQKRAELTASKNALVESVANSEASWSSSQRTLQIKTEELKKLEEAQTRYNNLKTQLAVLQQKSRTDSLEEVRLDQEYVKIQGEKNPYIDQCTRLENRLDDLVEQEKKFEKELKELNTELEVYKFWQRGFREIRLEQIDSTLIELEMATNRHAEELGLTGWEIGFATDRELKSGKISHSFTVNLYPPGQQDPIAWESYSGGESQRWQLATTFGLAEILLARSGIGTDFEILDEPTTSLSAEGIDDLLECLSNRARELNRRIFLIDHHSLDRAAFDGIITIKKSVKGGITIETGILGFNANTVTSEPPKKRVRL